jgi:D-alanyl-D-alanine carboxypeptidase/D-alanyl-D-alanine-endopeptidase (penicillin-binding protein 4)
VTGSFRVATDALPAIDQIDPAQLPHWATTLPISALNLNFNRVFFEWERFGRRITPSGWMPGVRQPFAVRHGLADDDRAAGLPGLHLRQRRAARRMDRGAQRAGQWRGALAAGPAPSAYAAEVFQMLARARGIALGTPVLSESAPARARAGRAREPAARRNPARHDALVHEPHGGGRGPDRDAGRRVRPTTLAESGAEMVRGCASVSARGRRGSSIIRASGVGSRIRPNDMTRALVAAGPNGMLRGLMRDIPILDERETILPTIRFRSWPRPARSTSCRRWRATCRTPSDRTLAFSIFCADLDRRRPAEPRPDGASPGWADLQPAGQSACNRR